MSESEIISYKKIIELVESLNKDDVMRFQSLTDILPQDELSMFSLDEICKLKHMELGVDQQMFEIIFWFNFGLSLSKEEYCEN